MVAVAPECRQDIEYPSTPPRVHAGELVWRQAQCAVEEQNEGTGLRRPDPAEWVSLPDWEDKLTVGAQRDLIESSASTSSFPTHDGHLRQYRSRNLQICEYNAKCAYKNDHASRAEPRQTGRLPRARHRRQSHPDPVRSRTGSGKRTSLLELP